MKVRRLIVSYDALCGVLMKPDDCDYMRVTYGLPRDAEVVEARLDPDRRRLVLFVASETFEDTHDAPIPEIEVHAVTHHFTGDQMATIRQWVGA